MIVLPVRLFGFLLTYIFAPSNRVTLDINQMHKFDIFMQREALMYIVNDKLMVVDGKLPSCCATIYSRFSKY